MKRITSLLLACLLLLSAAPALSASAASDTYYLFGWINGENYACEENSAKMGEFQFENGTLTATFDSDSYVAVKKSGNAAWYMTDGWQGKDVNSVQLFDTSKLGTNADKMFVQGGVTVIFTLAENKDGSLTLSYEENGGYSIRTRLWDFVNEYQLGAYYKPGDYYTNESVKKLDAAVAEGAKVLDNSGATYSELKAAYDNIKAVEKQLTLIDTSEKNSKLIYSDAFSAALKKYTESLGFNDNFLDGDTEITQNTMDGKNFYYYKNIAVYYEQGAERMVFGLCDMLCTEGYEVVDGYEFRSPAFFGVEKNKSGLCLYDDGKIYSIADAVNKKIVTAEWLAQYIPFSKKATDATENTTGTTGNAESEREEAKDRLCEMIERAERELPVGGAWTEESWKAYNEALSNAQKVYNDNNSTAEQYNQAYRALEKAFEGLTPFVGDKEELWSLIEQLEKVLADENAKSLPNYSKLTELSIDARPIYYYSGSQKELDDLRDEIKAELDKLKDPPESTGATEAVQTDPTEPSSSASSVTESGMTSATEPVSSTLAYDPQMVIGELKDGYKLCYFFTPPPPWMRQFSYFYGKYTFTNFLGEEEKNHGFYISDGKEKLMLSEAFEKGITDIDTVVDLIMKADSKPEFEKYGLKKMIINTDDINALLKKRYNRDFSVVDLGVVYPGLELFYNVPKVANGWVWQFTFNGYTFAETSGQTGENCVEDLGLFVVDTSTNTVYNLEEALKLPDSYHFLDTIVYLIKERAINYNFDIFRVTLVYGNPDKQKETGATGEIICSYPTGDTYPTETPTRIIEYSEESEPINTDDLPTQPTLPYFADDKEIEKQFIRYFNYMYKDEVTDDYLKDFAVFGDLDIYGKSKLVYGYHLEQPVEGSYIQLDEYRIWSPATDYTIGAGLYVYHDKMFERLDIIRENKKDDKEISSYLSTENIIRLIYSSDAVSKHKFRVYESEASMLVNEKFGNHFDNLVYLGEAGEGSKLYFNIPGTMVEWALEFEIGGYKFTEGGGQTGNNTPADLGLFVVNGGAAYDIAEAYNNKLVDMDKVAGLIDAKNLNYSFKVTKLDPTVCPTEAPTDQNLYAYRQYLAESYNKNNSEKYTADDFDVDLWHSLGNGIYLTHVDREVGTAAMSYECIDKYLYVSSGSVAEVSVYDMNEGKSYSVKAAYENDVIGKKTLREIKKILDNAEGIIVAKLYENVIELKAGGSAYAYGFTDNIKGKIENTAPKIAKISKDGTVTALAKGSAKLTATLKNGKTVSCTVKVTTDPKLTQNGKKVKTVTVKKGRSVKIKVSGKAKGVKLGYKSTRFATLSGKKTASTIKITGKKKGTSTATVKVNGKKLSLKIKVI